MNESVQNQFVGLFVLNGNSFRLPLSILQIKEWALRSEYFETLLLCGNEPNMEINFNCSFTTFSLVLPMLQSDTYPSLDSEQYDNEFWTLVQFLNMKKIGRPFTFVEYQKNLVIDDRRVSHDPIELQLPITTSSIEFVSKGKLHNDLAMEWKHSSMFPQYAFITPPFLNHFDNSFHAEHFITTPILWDLDMTDIVCAGLTAAYTIHSNFNTTRRQFKFYLTTSDTNRADLAIKRICNWYLEHIENPFYKSKIIALSAESCIFLYPGASRSKFSGETEDKEPTLYPTPEICICKTLYNSIGQVLNSIEIDSHCVAFDGKFDIYILPRYLKQYNLIDPLREYTDDSIKHLVEEMSFGIPIALPIAFFLPLPTDAVVYQRDKSNNNILTFLSRLDDQIREVQFMINHQSNFDKDKMSCFGLYRSPCFTLTNYAFAMLYAQQTNSKFDYHCFSTVEAMLTRQPNTIHPNFNQMSSPEWTYDLPNLVMDDSKAEKWCNGLKYFRQR